MNPYDWIAGHAERTPDKVAIRSGEPVWTYARLAREAAALAAALAASGVKHGDRVAFLGLNSAPELALLAACARLGAIFMPLNWRLTLHELRQLIADSEPAAIVADANFIETCQTLGAALPNAVRVAQGDAAPQGWLAYDAFLARGAGGPVPAAAGQPRDTLLLCYTSGSTGVPKGVMLSQDAVRVNALHSVEMHAMHAGDIVLATLPLFHVGGLNNQTTPALQVGATVVLHPKFEVDTTFDAIAREAVTLTVLVPAQLMAMFASPRWASADLSRLRMITTGSTIVPEHVTRGVHERGVPLVPIYGSTETCPIAASLRAEDAFRKAGSTGRVARECALRIVDEIDNDVVSGARGEVLVRGPNVMSGYWRQPEASAAALAGGWFHSGDLGHIDAEGYLWIDGRVKDMIISGGENIAPAEVENVLLECADIAEVSIVGEADARWGEIVVAVIAPRPGRALTAERVLALLDGRVARYKHPKRVVFVDALPKTALGKVRKEDVRRLVATEYGVPQSPKTENMS
ncbi:MAG TPA: AMP-binding protein [Burkholderiaceae bacterium]|nr:AMP-binding protein [Burkholderiaceae bacterium]